MADISKRIEELEKVASELYEGSITLEEAEDDNDSAASKLEEAQERLSDAREATKGEPGTDEPEVVLILVEEVANLHSAADEAEGDFQNISIDVTVLEIAHAKAEDLLRQERIEAQREGEPVKLSDLAESNFAIISDPAVIERLSDDSACAGFLAVEFGKFRPDITLWEVVEAWAGELFPEPDSLIRKVV